jgi:LacI family transcriptional regulator
VVCDKVIVDDQNGAKTAVEKLISVGCKEIALITTMDHVNVGKLRTLGYQMALDQSGRSIDASRILKLADVPNTEKQSDLLQIAIGDFLQRNPTTDGIFAVNEKYALTAIKMAQKLGKKVPEDIKVIGFTDGVLSKFSSPTLTTVSQHGKDLGAAAALLLIDRLECDSHELPYQTLIVPTELIERESTR